MTELTKGLQALRKKIAGMRRSYMSSASDSAAFSMVAGDLKGILDALDALICPKCGGELSHDAGTYCTQCAGDES